MIVSGGCTVVYIGLVQLTAVLGVTQNQQSLYSASRRRRRRDVTGHVYTAVSSTDVNTQVWPMQAMFRISLSAFFFL